MVYNAVAVTVTTVRVIIRARHCEALAELA
jgi:hypothetical protein